MKPRYPAMDWLRIVAAVCAALATAFLWASQSASLTFWLSYVWIDPYTASGWLCVAAVCALLLTVSKGLKALSIQALSLTKELLLRDMPGNKGLSPATWPILALCRMFLALVVVVHHTAMFSTEGPLLRAIMSLDGDKAVLLFFFISGFSIAHSVAKEPKGFYKRRAWRLLPVYWSCLALAAVAYLIAPEQVTITKGIELGTTRLPLAWALQIVPLYGLTATRIWTYFPAWSLGVELIFYAFAPLFVRLRLRWLIGLMAFSILFYMHGVHGPAVPRLWEWLGGFLFYRASGKVWAYALPFVPWLMMLRCDPWNLPHGTGMCLAFGLFVVALRWLPAFPKKIANLSFVVGDLSYPLYLVHAPAMWLIWLTIHSANPCLYLPVVGIATALIYWGVDLPCRRLAKSLQSPLSHKILIYQEAVGGA